MPDYSKKAKLALKNRMTIIDGNSSDGGCGEYNCSEKESFVALFNGMTTVSDRLNKIEQLQETVVEGQKTVNGQLVEQRVSMGKIETSLDYIMKDVVRHERELERVEKQTRSVELATAERVGRQSAVSSLLQTLWQTKKYWLLPILAGLTGYLSTKFGL